MVDRIRRKLLKTGAAAAALAATPSVLAQQSGNGESGQFYQKGNVRIRYEADQFLNRMFRNNPDFLFTVTRDFVKACQTPVLVLPDDTAGHSLAVAIESAMLAPKGQLSMYPWKDTPEKIPLAVRHVRSFLLSHRTT